MEVFATFRVRVLDLGLEGVDACVQGGETLLEGSSQAVFVGYIDECPIRARDAEWLVLCR
jgi:hypothetical protein